MTDEEGPELTFADVLNGIARSGGHRRDAAPEPAPQAPAPHPAPAPAEQIEELSSSVRAYAWTGGRTRANHQLEIETLVSTTARAEELLDALRSEHQSVARLCRHSKSVAEVGALLSLPLGVVRVLLDDMAGMGLVQVHRTSTGTDDRPDIELLERVRRGLANLRG